MFFMNEQQIEIIKIDDELVTLLQVMHAKLRDRYRLIEEIYDVINIIISIILCVLTFYDQSSISSNKIITMIGYLAIILFIFSLIKQRLNFKEKYAKHAEASNLLLRLKYEIRDTLFIIERTSQEVSDEKIIQLRKKLANTKSSIIEISDHQYLRLKKYFHKKRAYSSFLESEKSSFWLTSKFKFFFAYRNVNK